MPPPLSLLATALLATKVPSKTESRPPSALESFAQFVAAEAVEPPEALAAALDGVADAVGEEVLTPAFYERLQALRDYVATVERRAPDLSDPLLAYHLTEALNWIAHGDRGRVAATLHQDPVVLRASEILRDPDAYITLLLSEAETAVTATAGSPSP